MADLPFQGIRLRSEQITKRSRYLRIWRRRGLVLTSTYLVTIDETRNNKITEDISLFDRPVASCAANELNNPCAFKIVINTRRQNRTIYIIADSRESKDAWISAIADCVELAATFCWKYYWTYLVKFGNSLPSSEGEQLFYVSPDDSPEIIQEKYYKKLLDLSKESNEGGNVINVDDMMNGGMPKPKEGKEPRNDFIAELYLHLGMVYQGAKDYDRALRCCINSLTILKSVYGEKHIKVCDQYDIVGSLYSVGQQHQKAMEHYKAAFDTCVSIHGKNHLSTLEYSISLGEEYFYLDQYAKARECSNTMDQICKAIHEQPPEKWTQRMQSLKDKLASKGF